VCASAVGVADLAARSGGDDVFVVADGADDLDGVLPPRRVLAVEGRLEAPGDLMHIGSGYEIELMDYLVAPFVPVTRPTIIACLTSAAWHAFIDDADDARATGSFLPQLTARAAVIADADLIEAAASGAAVEVRRLTLDDDGSARYRLGGAIAGRAATIDLGEQSPTSMLCGDGEPADVGAELADALAARPWLSRYLAAVRVAATADGDPWHVVGFGRDLLGREAIEVSRRSRHVIAWRGDEHRLTLDNGRRFALGRDAAVAVDCLLEASSWDDAVLAVRDAGVTGPGTVRELRDLHARLEAAGASLPYDSDGGER
jgi:hypothetical protein